MGDQWHFLKTKAKKYSRTAMYHDIADSMIRNWLLLDDRLRHLGEQRDIHFYMEKAARFMRKEDKELFLRRFRDLYGELHEMRVRTGKMPRWKFLLDFKQTPVLRTPLVRQLHAFIRDYCLFALGHWECKQTPKGFEPTPRMRQLLQMFRERQVKAFVIDEYCTSKVRIGGRDMKYSSVGSAAAQSTYSNPHSSHSSTARAAPMGSAGATSSRASRSLPRSR